MATQDMKRAKLTKLKDSDLKLAGGAEDVRGRDVVDQQGKDIGKVNALFIDEDERKVRFLEVGAGGFLGIGEKTFMIPVDAITRIDDKHVHIDRSVHHVMNAPAYDPNLVEDTQQWNYWDNTYRYYGYTPYWAPGYRYPGYPYYP
jgi:sporulation protein YlmC with PRC-barrel domain